MALWQGRSHRKPTGGILRSNRGKRKFEIGSEVHETTIGKQKIRQVRTTGGAKKVKVAVAEVANITNPKTGKTQKFKIKSVIQNTANPHYVRRNIVTKGAVIETEGGKARVTSRPGQDGTVNAVMLE
ncbi:MAG: 30S ribosomal protein S8e [Thermoplasmata archaeon HGW-Thermoplasmata-2]|nr:MAG: 30S ribosomal protein S8e [Thermoplasmata archaeon HGW-Thermoplasmata-2]